MKEYLDLVKLVMKEGTRKSSHTGIDTISYFGAFYEADLSKGFPSLTTKKWNGNPCYMKSYGIFQAIIILEISENIQKSGMPGLMKILSSYIVTLRIKLNLRLLFEKNYYSGNGYEWSYW